MTQNCSCHGSGGLSQTVAAVLERPRYSPGLILEDADLTAAVDYTRDLNRLLFRNLFGCGVICGLAVKAAPECGLTITVAPGLALDGCGDPVQLPKGLTFTVDEKQRKQWEEAHKELWVVLCGKEKFCQPRPLVCDADEFDGAMQTTRIRAQAQVTVLETKPACVCGHPEKDGETAAHAGVTATGAEAGHDHEGPQEAPDDCAADCGCGSACDCGCCVLLARIYTDGKAWFTKHAGVRRFIRPQLIADPRTDTGVQPMTIVGDDPKTGAPVGMETMLTRIREEIVKTGKLPAAIKLTELGIVPRSEIERSDLGTRLERKPVT